MKQIILSVLLSFLLLSGIAQEQCISCYQNDVNFLKYSSAIGTYNFSYGASSLAFGNGNSVKGDYAVAMGQNNKSNGLGSFAGGIACQATGDYASAFGNAVKATGRSAFAAGLLSEANGYFSVAMGHSAKTGSHSAIALGFCVEAIGPASFVAGSFLKSGASNAITLGSGDDLANMLENNHPSSLMIGFNSTKPTFIVSESPSGGDKTGKIGIGNVTTPTAKLHIKADANEDASVLLEPTGNYYGKLMIGTSDHFIQAKSGSNMHFETERNQNFVFENGNVGIGVGISTISNKLEVAGYANTSSGYKVGNNLVINNQSNFVGNDVLTPNGNGYFGGQLFVGDIAFFNEKVGIHNNDPSCELDVNGDISAHNISASGLKLTDGTQAIGKILQSDDQGNATWASPQPSDDGDWTISGNNVYRDGGKVGIGTTDPQADLHIINQDGNVDKTYFKVESPDGSGSGTTEIGRLSGSGPAIIQQAGNANFTNGGTCTSIRQMSYNNEHGLRLSTFTNTDGSVDHAEVRCMTSSLHAIAKDTLYLRSNESGIEFQIGGYNTKMRLNEYGQLGIGTNTHMDQGETKLTVAGRIHAKEVKVTTGAGGGADFVFEEDYNLPDIDEVDRFIKANKHLPDIPSADEMVNNGIDLGDMQIKLLQKVEELTLYVIELKKENEEMKGEIETLKKK